MQICPCIGWKIVLKPILIKEIKIYVLWFVFENDIKKNNIV